MEIIPIKKNSKEMIFLAEKNFEIVYKENGKNKKLLNNYNWKIFNNFNNSVIQHSMIFNKSLEFYKIGVTTNCGVKWFECRYLFNSEEECLKPIITFEGDHVNIHSVQFCGHKMFFHKWKIVISNNDESKKGCFYLFFFFNN